MFAWTGPLGQDYHEDLPDQARASIEWLGVPHRVVITDSLEGKFGERVVVRARLLGQNPGGQRLVLLVERDGAVVYAKGTTTSLSGRASFFYRGPPDLSDGNDDELVEVLRVFWDRNRNGVHDGPAEFSDEATVTWDDL